MRSYDVQIALEGSDDYVSFRDLGLACLGWNFPQAEPRTETLPVTGGDGDFDLSDGARGAVGFNSVEGEIRVYAFRDTPAAEFLAAGRYDHSGFIQMYHGQRVKLIASCDPGHYRLGRIWIEEGGDTTRHKEFTLRVISDPYRYKLEETIVTFQTINETVPTKFKHGSYRGVYDDDLTNEYQEINAFSFRHSYLEDYPAPFYTAYMEVQPETNYLVSYEVRDDGFYKAIEPELWLYKNGQMVKRIDKTFFSEDCDAICFRWYINWWLTGHVTYYGLENIVLAVQAPHEIINTGRKIVIPTITADVDCVVSSGNNSISLLAGVPTLAWDLPLRYGPNMCASLASEVGTVEIKFREGLL